MRLSRRAGGSLSSVETSTNSSTSVTVRSSSVPVRAIRPVIAPVRATASLRADSDASFSRTR